MPRGIEADVYRSVCIGEGLKMIVVGTFSQCPMVYGWNW